ncbi:hypothetical protein [Terrarubrum flagellatum]|uniref:hypothetical protein n=1 Tax=Terrirubrum flagellatum TaxID=2895980 RepID=UPI0031454C82
MIQLCEVNQIGRVGKVRGVDPNLMISIASDASYEKNGETTYGYTFVVSELTRLAEKPAKEEPKPAKSGKR